ncbi:hypothetical protein H3O04_14550 [Burkholderia sp. KCJ3K979]|uniref:hypothetical protein n=1 Tax=Burkholderia sp. KCJ3K979 TaxID=2759149 RepID=UPI0019299B85|nr:hypothetical protein [Burkholderia sp. KCJ3K979]MBL3963718.1 hypothetical protein [Burkholderia sp. KCJ3K979]
MSWQAEATLPEQLEMLARVSMHADKLSGLFNSIIAVIDALARDAVDSKRLDLPTSVEPRITPSR